MAIVKESVGVKWRPIRVNNRFKKEAMDSNRIYALHIEAATEKAAGIRQKLATWYGSRKSLFPDGTKVHLVPPFQTILSYAYKGKYSALVTRQANLTSRLCTGSTWELSSNYVLDRVHSSSGLSLRKVLMDIPSSVFPKTPYFTLWIECRDLLMQSPSPFCQKTKQRRDPLLRI